MKTNYIIDLKNGQRGKDLFLIKQVSSATSSKGSIYLNLVLEDKTGVIDAKFWDPNPDMIADYKAGAIVEAAYNMGTYQEKLQMTVQSLVVIDSSTVDISEFIKKSEVPEETLKTSIKHYLNMIENPIIKKITVTLFQKFGKDFFEYPAATKNHHDFYGGLAQHTMEMAELAVAIQKIFPFANLDLLLAGVLIHDMGKMIELSGAIGTEYTLEGSLIGHISIMHAELLHTIKALGYEDKEESLLLRHMLLAHHGQLEWGSPVRPQILEAELLARIDDLDAKVTMIRSATVDVEPGSFSEKVFGLENRKIYVPKNEKDV